MNNNSLKDKFAEYCKGIRKEGDVWNYYHDIKHANENPILLEKIGKLIDLLNNDESKIMHLDIQDELYDIL